MRQRFKITSVMALTLSLFAFETAAQDELNVVSWDGAYVKSQILGFIRPYEDETGTGVNVIQYTGVIEEIRRQVRAWNVKWDVVDLQLFDAIRACEEGLLEPIDPESLPAAPDGTPAWVTWWALRWSVTIGSGLKKAPKPWKTFLT